MAVEVRDTGWVDSRSMFYRRSFSQREVRRANGDRVWVTGDYRWEVDEVRRWLMKEARRANLRMIQIAEMAGLAEGPNEEEDYLSALATAEVVVELEPDCDPVGELHRRLAVMRQDNSLLVDALPDAELIEIVARADEKFSWLIANDPNPARAARAERDQVEWRARMIPLLDRLGRPKGVLRRRKKLA
jgi:hypothetical protein